MRRIFITGATGFLGRNLIQRLVASEWHAVALLLPGESPESIHDDVTVVHGDITDPTSLRGLIDGCEAVVHLAGAVGYGQTMPRCIQLNVDGTYNVFSEAARAGVQHFVHMSSVSVYGRVPQMPLPEEAPLKRIGDPYGDTKIDAEDVARRLAARNGITLTVLRPTVIYGPGDDKFLPRLVDNLRSGRARIIGDGSNSVDLVHVDDVVDFMLKSLEDRTVAGGTYNLNNPNNPSWREFLALVANELGLQPPDQTVPYPVALALAGLMELASRFGGGPPRLTRYAVRVVGRQYRYLTDRAQRAGFAPQVSLKSGVSQSLSAFL